MNTEITLKSFTDFLRQHKDVCVTFKASCIHNHNATYRYQVSHRGMVIEVYTYNRTVYGICHIDNERAMSDNFTMSLRYALKMEPTCLEDRRKFVGVLDEDKELYHQHFEELAKDIKITG